MSAPRSQGGDTNRSVTNFSATAWPGYRATSFPQEVRPGVWGLVLRLDPVDLFVTQAPFPEGATHFVEWCRQLSRSAGQLAIHVETSLRAPRHYADEWPERDDGSEAGEQL